MFAVWLSNEYMKGSRVCRVYKVYRVCRVFRGWLGYAVQSL